jgi:hypothetical protein
MKTLRLIATALFVLIGILPSGASDYLTYLTSERGFAEVSQAEELFSSNGYYYILTSAEDNGLIVGVGAYEDKPGWASADSKALRYVSAESDPILERSHFFTIENDGTQIGLRNIVYSADLFQTHNEAGFMYVNTFTDKSLDEWSHLSPTFQDGYWLFESGKYPIAGGAWYSGYLGPWNNEVKEGEAIALNRKNTTGDEAGHYRLFRIAKDVYETLYAEAKRQQLFTATASQPIDATWLIVNPSFETGDVTGWTRIPNVTDDNEFNTRDYGMTDKEGGYLFNAYQWWASSLGVTQTVEHVPSGRYELSAVVATWEGREVTFSGNFSSVTKTGINDATGIPVSIPLTITGDDQLTISAGSTAQWWNEGHEGEQQTFFKLDNVRLVCQGVFLDGMALPLPNDDTTLLKPGEWYYYEVSYPTQYRLKGNLTDMVWSSDGFAMASDISTQPAEKKLTFTTGRVYFKTTRSDATLSITTDREMEAATFTATALNVDGLPQKILGFIEVNADGPGSNGTKLISKYLSTKGYDIIGVSEDFNYHGSLMNALEGTYASGTVRATLSIGDLSIPFDTDGLNLIWKKGLVDSDSESWTRWETTTPDEGNQYVKKGFRHYEMTPADGMVIDVYVLHMDAGDKSVASREAQWEQLADSIRKGDSSRPKLIIGDTNSRWTREDIKGRFFDQLPQYNISDVWVELCRNNEYPTTSMNDITDSSDPTAYSNYEVVDKIIYLNPKADNTLQLSAKSFKIERDYIYGEVDGTDSAKPLGDHKPVVVEFSCQKSGDVKPLPGDVNRDGRITVADIMATVSIIMGKDKVEPYVFDHVAADINEDSRITVTDVMAIVAIVVNK